MRVVLDTNVYVSAILFGGLPELPIRLAGRGSITLLVSDAIIAELIGVVIRKFGWPPDRIIEIEQEIRRLGEVVSITSDINAVSSDDADNRILECAVDGRADLIVSGDHHLLALGSYQGIRVVSPRDFAETVNRKR
jgi:putative PIN family toxin of toxin-antitoxin system